MRKNRFSRSRFVLAAICGILVGHAATTGISARAGGPEHQVGGLEERWANPNISWSILIRQQRAVPGFNEVFGTDPFLSSVEQVPADTGVFSFIEAARKWNQARVHDTTTVATNINISLTPTLIDGTPLPFLGSPWKVGDGSPMVSAWESPNVFAAFGSTTSIGIAVVSLDPNGTALIFDADIAINARSVNPVPVGSIFPVQQRNIFTFIERRSIPVVQGSSPWPFSLPSIDIASSSFSTGLGNQFRNPRLSFNHLVGVMTHEFGHFLGFGHSLLDGDMGGVMPADIQDGPDPDLADDREDVSAEGFSRSPTMFPRTVLEDYLGMLETIEHEFLDTTPEVVVSVGLSAPAGPGDVLLHLSTDPTTPIWEGIGGFSASELSPDDVAAAIRSYGSPAGLAATGSIAGIVRLNNVNTVLPGAHVVAVKRDQPRVRVGTLSFENGLFRIDGLPPGEYWVYCEPVDAVTVNGLPKGAVYFPLPSDLPAFVGFPGGGAIPTPFIAEFWNTGNVPAAIEGFGEPSPMRASPVNVPAGGTSSTFVDMRVDTGTFSLGVQRQTNWFTQFPGGGGVPIAAWGVRSQRGAVVNQSIPFFDTYPQVRLNLQAPAAYRGPAALLIGADPLVMPTWDQLCMVAPIWTIPLPAFTSSPQLLIPLGPIVENPYQFTYPLFQVIYGATSSSTSPPYVLSNPVNLWIN